VRAEGSPCRWTLSRRSRGYRSVRAWPGTTPVRPYRRRFLRTGTRKIMPTAASGLGAPESSPGRPGKRRRRRGARAGAGRGARGAGRGARGAGRGARGGGGGGGGAGRGARGACRNPRRSKSRATSLHSWPSSATGPPPRRSLPAHHARHSRAAVSYVVAGEGAGAACSHVWSQASG
jgi:hypothetical protein